MSKVRARSQKTAGSGRTEAKKDVLVQAIGSWASEEMKFNDSSIPAPEELKVYVNIIILSERWARGNQ